MVERSKLCSWYLCLALYHAWITRNPRGIHAVTEGADAAYVQLVALPVGEDEPRERYVAVRHTERVTVGAREDDVRSRWNHQYPVHILTCAMLSVN